MLELIDGDAIWEEANRIGKMNVTVFVRFIKEEIHVWLSEEFHRHGVDFAALSSWRTIRWNLDVGRLESLEGMSELMGKDIDVTRGAVEVREDDWGSLNWEVGHITTALFARFGIEKEEVMVVHVTEVFGGVFGHLVIHLDGGVDLIFGGSFWSWVAIREHEVEIIDLWVPDS